MRKLILVMSFMCICFCAIYSANYPVEYIKINQYITVHRSYEIYNGYKTPSNGLIIEGKDSVLLIDTAWNNEETNQIISYVEKTIKKKVSSLIITHSHSDRAGGIDIAVKDKIKIYMNEETYSLLHKDIPYQKIVYGNQKISGIDLDIQYFGPAHSQDNIVVFFPKYDVLFGGCIIKSLDTKSIGNIEDANVLNWPIVLEKMITQYRNVSIVIPGHGEVGNFDLLTHTRDLFK